MTGILVGIYTIAFVAEAAGVVLVVREIVRVRKIWNDFQSAVEQERRAIESDLRYSLDPLTTRYGLRPAALHRTVTTVESLVEVNFWRQILAVVVLLGGLLVGFVGNVISIAVH